MLTIYLSVLVYLGLSNWYFESQQTTLAFQAVLWFALTWHIIWLVVATGYFLSVP